MVATAAEPATGGRVRSVRRRSAVNRVVVVAAIAVVAPLVVVIEALRKGSGGRLIRRAVLVLAPLAGVRWEIRGLERLDPSCSYVFTPNHASPLDIPSLYVVHPRVRFAAAAELFRPPFLGPAMRALGTIPIERRRPEVARAVLADVAAHPGRAACLVVFPEGRLAPAGELLPFKSGPFILAIQAGLPIAPVAVHHASALMPRGSGLRLTPGRIVVEVLDPVPTDNLVLDDRHALKDGVRSALLGALRLEDGGTTARPDLGPFT